MNIALGADISRDIYSLFPLHLTPLSSYRCGGTSQEQTCIESPHSGSIEENLELTFTAIAFSSVGVA